MAVLSQEVNVEDIVLHGREAGKVLACVSAPFGLFVVAVVCSKISELTPHADVFRPRAGQELAAWPGASLVQPAAWYFRDDGSIVVLR